MTKLIELNDVSVRYGTCEALSHVYLDIHQQDFLGIIGPNGGGKTTLVKAILKAVPYTGKVIYSKEIESGGYRRIGYMPQISDLDKTFPISVREVVLSGLQARKKLFGRYTSADREKAENLLRICGIESVARRPIGALSGGQLQRALLGRALIRSETADSGRTDQFRRQPVREGALRAAQTIQRQNGHRHGIARSGNDFLPCQANRLRQPPCASPRLQPHHGGAIAQLRLPDTGRLSRRRAAYGARKALVKHAEKLRELLRTFFYSSRTDVRSTFRLFANAAKLLEHRIHA